MKTKHARARSRVPVTMWLWPNTLLMVLVVHRISAVAFPLVPTRLDNAWPRPLEPRHYRRR